MIPPNIRREHVLKAIKEIDKYGIPPGRNARKYFVEYNGKLYPPKLVISKANKYANGDELPPSMFTGGDETNNYLKRLGFKIVEV